MNTKKEEKKPNNQLSKQAGKKKKKRSNPNFEKHQWKKGQSGNPKGKPKGTLSLTTILRNLLSEPGTDGKTKGDELMELAVKHAKKGNYGFFREIYNRIEGKMPDKLENINASGIDLSGKTDEELAGIRDRLRNGDMPAEGES